MPTLQVCVCDENARFAVSQRAAETMGIWQEKGGFSPPQKDNEVRDHV